MNFFEQIYDKKVLLKNMTLTATIFLLMISQLDAVNYTFTPTVVGNNWNNGANWSPAGGPPTATDGANVDSGNTANVTTADTAGSAIFGVASNGTVAVTTGGTLTLTNTSIGNSAAITGTLTVTGPTATWNNSAGPSIIGVSGIGVCTISSGGNSTLAGTTMGLNAGSTGTLTLAGTGSSGLNSGATIIGNAGTGTLNINTGASYTSVGCDLGESNGSNGTLNVTDVGTTFTNFGTLLIAVNGTSTATLSNGSQTSTSNAVIANGATAVGILNLNSTGVNRGLLKTGGLTGGAGNSTLNFNGGVLQAAGTNLLFLSGLSAVNIGPNGAFIDSQIFNITIPQSISGVGGLTKQGTSRLILNGTNTFGGDITISDGTLQGTIGSSLPTATPNVIDNGIFIIDHAPNTTYAANISGTGSLVKNSGGNLTLAPASGTNSYQGGTTISAGTIITTATGIGTGPVLNNASLVFDQTTTSSFGGNITGTGSLTKQGTGTTILTGSNSFSGGTTISVGTLQVNSTSIGTGPIIDNASLVFDQATTGSFNVNISGSGTLTKQNAGTLILGGTNTYLGGTIITGGVLQGNTVSIPASNGVLNNASLVFDQATNNAYTGNITGTGSFTKQNVGTLILAGTNTYAGGTTISGGVLQGSTTNIPNGAVLDNASLVFDQPVDGTFIGNISGTGTLTKQNAGTLILAGTNSYSGGTAVNGGILQGNSLSLQSAIVDNTAVIFDQTFDGTYAGSLSGAGNLTKQGAGRLQMTGNSGTFIGNATVTTGNLNVNGILGGNTTVNLGAIISGNGFLTNLTNNGTVAPGNSIGTLHVVNFVNGPTGVYEAEINGSGASDLIAASGTATLNGGQLVVITNPGIYFKGTTYTIIEADAGLSGQFASTILPANIPLSVMYLPNSLILTVLANTVDITGLSGNALRVARYISTINDPDPDFLVVSAALNSLTDPAARQSAYNQLHPALYQALALTVSDTAHLINRTFVDRLNYLRLTSCCDSCDHCADTCQDTSLWSAGVADFIRYNRTGELRRFNAMNQGLSVGVDKRINNSIFAGVGAGYTHTNLHWGDSAGHSYIDGYYVGAYATKYTDTYYVDAATISYVNQHHARRHIHFADIDRNAKNRHYSYGFNPHLGAGAFLNYCSVNLIPFFNVDYYLVQQNRIREHGAESLNLHVKRNQGNLLRLETGLEFTKCYEFSCGNLLPSASISYVAHRVLSGKKFIASFVGVDSNFDVFGTKHCFNQVELGAGVMYILDDSLAVNAWYDVELGHKRQEQEVNLEFNYRF